MASHSQVGAGREVRGRPPRGSCEVRESGVWSRLSALFGSPQTTVVTLDRGLICRSNWWGHLEPLGVAGTAPLSDAQF